ncbi:MAG: hypothetical protein KJI70_00455 [Patescibacteria group bacterium]|nr:hypothetical protein [Patescibacteria group bacterium]
MIRFDACLGTCSGASFENRFSIFSEDEEKCSEKCREKYAITWEEYNNWKNK